MARQTHTHTDDVVAVMENDQIKVLKAKIARSKRLLLKYRVYNFLHRPVKLWSKIYHVLSFCLLFVCFFVSIYPGLVEYLEERPTLKILELIVLVWFSVEFLINFWASDCQPQYQGLRGKVRFLVLPTHLIELIIIALSVVIAIALQHEGYEVFAFQMIRGFNRLFQVMQMLTINRQLHPWKMLLAVLYRQRRQIILMGYIEILLITSVAYLIFVIEHEQNESLSSYYNSIWWSVETLSTTGYGDRVPKTAAGRIICGLYIVLSVAVFALQGTFIGVGWALKAEENERDKLINYKRNMAALVIQKAWKCYWEAHIHETLKNTFGHLEGVSSILRERLNEQTIQLFHALLNFHVAKAKLCELRRPMELKNIIEAQKFEQTVIKLKMKQIADKVDTMLAKLASVVDNDNLDLDVLVDKYHKLKQLHSGVAHCVVCCEKLRRQQQRVEELSKRKLELPNDVYATITSLMSESSLTATPMMLKRILQGSVYSQTAQVPKTPPATSARKESRLKRTRRRFSQWFQHK